MNSQAKMSTLPSYHEPRKQKNNHSRSSLRCNFKSCLTIASMHVMLPSPLACNLTFHDKDVRSRSVGLDWCRLLLSYEHVADLRFHSKPSILSKPIREQQFNEHHCHGNAHRDIKTTRCGTYTCILKKTCPQTHTQTHTHTCLVDFFL